MEGLNNIFQNLVVFIKDNIFCGKKRQRRDQRSHDNPSVFSYLSKNNFMIVNVDNFLKFLDEHRSKKYMGDRLNFPKILPGDIHKINRYTKN